MIESTPRICILLHIVTWPYMDANWARNAQLSSKFSLRPRALSG